MTCIIVLGCFRSGTSAVAGALHHMGVFMGDQFDAPHQNNPKGFFEDLEFKRIHGYFDDALVEADFLYENLIRKRENEYQLWGVKDPLLCLYLNKLTGLLHTDHKVIVCRRSITQIAISMATAIGSTEPTWYVPLASKYVEDMDNSLAEYRGPVLEVQKTESMLQILEPISEFVGLPITQTAREFLS